MNRTERFAVIDRYLASLRALGNLRAGSASLREALRSGALDLWTASETRESSLWRDETLPDQIRALLNDGNPNARTKGHDSRLAASSVSAVRTAAAWIRALSHSVRRSESPHLAAEVVFVQYWPTPPSGSAVPTTNSWQSPYFGSLPERLMAAGISVGFLHLHADGPVTVAPSVVRNAVKNVSSSQTRHALVADAMSPRAWLRALRDWQTVARRLPTESQLSAQIPADSELARLWPWWGTSLRRSVRGGHGVRAALLTEMFGSVVRANASTKLWVVAFEGQGWESCLARQLDAAGARWLPYVHTMMRPWDLRARTFLSEYPVQQLAIHGLHDRTELASLGVSLVDVEALRYQHLASASRQTKDDSKRSDIATWLVVGGGDCENSHAELADVLAAMRQRGVTRHLVARWHPQCARPVGEAVQGVEFTVEPLHELTRRADAALMVGRAAPLDTYLAGVPSCYLLGASGLEMSPVEENPGHHAATNADDAVSWMMSAEGRKGFAAPIDDYFVVDDALPRWMSLVKKLIG